MIWRYGTTIDLQCFVGFTSINYLNQLPQSINYLINNNSAMLNNRQIPFELGGTVYIVVFSLTVYCTP